MSEQEKTTLWLIVVTAISLGCGLYSGWTMGMDQGAADERQRAVEQGAASWDLDVRTGRHEFRYRRGLPWPLQGR